MKMEITCDRRKFIKSAAIASGLAVLLGRVRPAAAKTKQPLPQEKSSRGYRLTEHIKKYYETARL
ncbi:MAG: twin-arginine translocation signal domain-containing protein [Syntrophales bacterium]|jgi:hypothetical protein